MARALLFASALVVAATAVRAENACQLVKIAEWPLWKNHYLPVVEGAINGQKVGVLLDTGAFATFVQRSAAAKLALRRTSRSPSGG